MKEWDLLPLPIISGVLTLSLAGFVVYYLIFVCKKPKLYCNNHALERFLDKHVKVIKEKYYPSPLYFEGRLQSFIGVALREIQFLPYTRDIIQLEDGGQLALDILQPNLPNQLLNSNKMEEVALREKLPPLIVLILPGLTSCSQDCYMKTLSLAVTEAGAVAVALNNRGMGGVEIKTPRLFSASNCEDLVEVIDYLSEKFPHSRIMSIGISMGGMQLSHYMIKYPEKAKVRLTAALVVSAIWDTEDGLKNLENGFLNKYIVNLAIALNLVSYAKIFRKDLDSRDCWDFDKILKARTVFEFDDRFTGPQFGFPNAEAYYAYTKISGRTGKFPIPVIALSAADDPLQPGDYLPKEEALANGSNLALIVSKYGGHVGFLEGILPIKKRINYLERIVIEVVQAIQEHGAELILHSKEKETNGTL